MHTEFTCKLQLQVGRYIYIDGYVIYDPFSYVCSRTHQQEN